MAQISLQAAADILDNARLNHQSVAPLAQSLPDFTLQNGYKVQELGLNLRLNRGEKIIGYKMGFTSKAKMEQMGLHSPICGYLTDKMRLSNASVLDLKTHIHPKAEPEVVFKLAHDLRGKISYSQAIQAIEAVTVGLEILDSRFVGFKYFSLPDVVADNCSASEFIVSDKWMRPNEVDMKNMSLYLKVNGETKHQAPSSAILGDPVEALVALSSLLGERNIELKKGHLVLAGAATQAEGLQSGTEISAEMFTGSENFGKVSVHG